MTYGKCSCSEKALCLEHIMELWIGIISSTDLVFALLGCGAEDADADVAIDPNRLGNLYRPGIY